jgi:hypothetical protein
MKLNRIVAVAAVIFAASGSMVLAQRSGGPYPSQPAPAGAGSIPSIDANRSGFPVEGGNGSGRYTGIPYSMSARVAGQQEKARNNERHKKVISDTDKLVVLVNELKTQMDADKTLSPAETSKRAEEIEKLARSVKDKMKG